MVVPAARDLIRPSQACRVLEASIEEDQVCSTWLQLEVGALGEGQAVAVARISAPGLWATVGTRRSDAILLPITVAGERKRQVGAVVGRAQVLYVAIVKVVPVQEVAQVAVPRRWDLCS